MENLKAVSMRSELFWPSNSAKTIYSIFDFVTEMLKLFKVCSKPDSATSCTADNLIIYLDLSSTS